MKRMDLIQYPISLQKAIFNASTPEQKADFWICKLNEVLELGWTCAEESHIKCLRDHVKAMWFLKEIRYIRKQNEEVSLFLKKWIEDGQKKFGWSKEIAFAIAGTLDIMADTKGTILQNYSKDYDIKNLNSPCGCSQESDWCGLDESCKGVKCEGTSWGCGTLWWHRCDGKCRSSYDEPAPEQ